MSTANGKPLRFAALIRVSTEKQAAKGESLRTQRSQIEAAVASLGGRLVATYAGQEHGTAGYERQQLDRLLADAAKKPRPFDAVVVATPTRWSRDNVRSETGLDVLRDNGVRFFVLGVEYSLYEPTQRFMLGQQTAIGALQAATQKQQSMLNRIERAKRGLPTGGKVPFGRSYDKAAGKWVVDPVKQTMIRDVAERYLAGEPLPKLAKEYGVNHANLCKVLRERCGTTWTLDFAARDLNIRETVTLTVPRLLDEKTIRAVRQRLEANRTYLHGNPTHDYLLSGRVFCAVCGYAMFGQANRSGHLYYRHAHTERARACDLRPRPWVRADKLEAEVVDKLFETLGNPAAIERAVKAATPDCDRALKQRSRLEAEVAKVERSRSRILGLIAKDAITDAQAEGQLRELKEREAGLRAGLDKLAAVLADVPDAKQIRVFVEHWADGTVFVYDQDGYAHPGGNDLATFLAMTRDDHRRLIDVAFAEPLPDGTPPGVYLAPVGGARFGPKTYSYVLRGRLVGKAKGVMPRASR